VLAADHRITAWARQLKRAGLDGDMDQLRARAFLDLLTGTDSRPTGQAATDDHAATARQDSTTGQPGPAHPADLTPAGFATRGTLTIPLATLLGLADRPGQLAGTPIDPWLARDLAHAAATSPTTTWCVTATSHHGHATWHACARPAPASHTRHGRRGKRGGPGPPVIAKGVMFCRPQYVDSSAAVIFRELHDDDCLRGLRRDGGSLVRPGRNSFSARSPIVSASDAVRPGESSGQVDTLPT
jgi:hypothetical protein